MNKPQLVTWNLQQDIGMTCGGEITYLFEHHHHASWPIVVFGAGHVAQALIRFLIYLPCQVICMDDRKEWLEKLPNSPNLKKILIREADSMRRMIKELHKNSYFIVMTQGHAKDLPILKELFQAFPEAPFIGGIGSDLKGIKIRRELCEFGISQSLTKKFICPIGLPIGSNNPYEIAISICAQLLQVRG